jgi:hypothetical protein
MELQWALMDIAVEWRGALDVRERGWIFPYLEINKEVQKTTKQMTLMRVLQPWHSASARCNPILSPCLGDSNWLHHIIIVTLMHCCLLKFI